MKRNLFSLTLFLLALSAHAAEPARVMLVGTFHFQNPGLDVVKSQDMDIFTEESQSYLQAFTARLAGFKPSRVLLEYSPEEDEVINERYREYLAGNDDLPANEIYQLGFRIARESGNDRVYGFDQRDIEWQADAMFAYAGKHDSPEMAAFNQIIGQITADDKKARATMPLRELLIRANDPLQDRINMDLYLVTNAIGAGDGYAGADAAASWWRRNFRMYANIQRLAQPDERIIAIGGSGHMAILKQLLSIDRRLQGVAADPYF